MFDEDMDNQKVGRFLRHNVLWNIFIGACVIKCWFQWNIIGDFTFWLKTFAETFAEPKLQSKYLLKLKSEVILLSENMATNTDSLVN